MTITVQQALQVMAIGLPVMFCVILLFMGVAKLLFVIFPDSDDEVKS